MYFSNNLYMINYLFFQLLTNVQNNYPNLIHHLFVFCNTPNQNLQKCIDKKYFVFQ